MRHTRVDGHKPRVALIFGGRSAEHAISCATAGSVLQAINRERYDVIPVGITTQGRWVLESDRPDRLAIADGHLPAVDEEAGAVVLAGDPTNPRLVTLESADLAGALGGVDVVFPLLHGPFGEDGTLQGLLEMAGVRYAGSGVLASAMAMDKHYTKLVLQSHGLPVAPYTVIRPAEWERDPAACAESVSSLGYPVFVKPARGGSSLGISKVTDHAVLHKAVEEALRFDPKVIVEKAIEGARELECGVLESAGGNAPRASQVAEIGLDGTHEFYDFQAKYLPEEDVALTVPAELEEPVSDEIRRIAVTAFEALSCEGLARVDFFLGADQTVLVNEINTMPGFTSYSMFPRMWAASGITYPGLIDHLLQLALQRRVGLR